MSRNPSCKVYIGNLDEKVSEKVLYEILIQVGHVVDLYIPRDKETNRHKGYAFAEYESKQIADYAVRLFSGLVRLHNRTLKFAISGQDKPSQNIVSTVTPKPNSSPLARSHAMPVKDSEMSESAQSMVDWRVNAHNNSMSPNYPQASTQGYVNNGLSASNFEYSRRVFGSMLNSTSHPDPRQPIPYASY